MTGDTSPASLEIVERHAAGGIDRRDAIRRLGMLGIGGVVAGSLLGAPGASAKTTPRQPYRILAFVGGGIRGMASARMLIRLTAQHPQLLANADLLAGCSVGSSIISSVLAGKTPAQIYQGMATDSVEFFKHPNTDRSHPAFPVEEVVHGQQLLHPTNPKLSDVKRKVLFTSFNVRGSQKDTWRPLLFNNLSKSTNAHTSLIDAVVSSGAMPAQMASWKGNIDGAFVNHDPSLAAIALAVNEGVALSDITLICFGTGLMSNCISSDTATWGAQQWQNGAGNPKDNTPSVLINGTDSPILNATLNGTSTNLTPTLVSMMLGKRYAYLNPTLDRFIPEDDTDPADLSYLVSQANHVKLGAASNVAKRYWSAQTRGRAGNVR
jgi:patatin-like phospholipase/acyl hydrolase